MADWTKPDPSALDHRIELSRELFAISEDKRRARIVARERAVHGAVPMDDVEWLLECDPRMTAHQMAPRFDISVGGLRAACKRAGRFDLLDRLVRNAELAGHNVSRAS